MENNENQKFETINTFVRSTGDRNRLNISLNYTSKLNNISAISSVMYEINQSMMIDLKPMYKAIYYIHNNITIDENDSIEFFKSSMELRKLHSPLESIIDVDDIMISSAAEFVMLGFSIDAQEQFTGIAYNKMYESYYNLVDQCVSDKLTLLEFIKDAGNLINGCLSPTI